ncbi:MAG: hypothetical protein ABFC57_17230 [Veillonellales bacterium]
MAGLLLFGKSSQLRRPALMVKAISFFGNEIEGTLYRDSEDIKGNIPELFKDSMAFFMRNLHKLQNNKPFNSVGDLEIPKIVLEELLVNASFAVGAYRPEQRILSGKSCQKKSGFAGILWFTEKYILWYHKAVL